MAKTTVYNRKKWDTLHNNGPFPLKILYKTELEAVANMPDDMERYNDAALEIQALLQETLDAGEGFRAFGSRWSLSNIAHHEDRMHYNGLMKLHLPLTDEDFHEYTNFDHSNLFFFQCGNTIKGISQTLTAHGKSLKTTGASNGQTIAGCISTGVHGSAIDVGSVQDYVVGINLITGPNPADIVYIERASRPALSDRFGQKINAEVIRNDELFNAALVGLGAFGFIHGVVLEAEDRFLLKRYVRKIDKEVALELANSLDFKNSSFRIPEETDEKGFGLRPYHYKLFINPYNDGDQYTIELMYKKPYSEPYPDPFPFIKQSVYRDLIYLIMRIAERSPKRIPWFIKRLKKVILPEENEVLTGTLPEIFWDAPYQGPAFACSVGVDHRDASKALNLLVKLTKDEGPIPGIYAMRFVKQSAATLAFSKFPYTCMIEIDGVLWKKTKKIMSLEEFSKRMIEVLQENQIPFTLHWGKNSDWAFPDLVHSIYGEQAEKWLEMRKELLSPEMAQLFSSPFLETIGMSGTADDLLVVDDNRIAAPF